MLYKRRPMAVMAHQFDGSSEMARKLYLWHRSVKGQAQPTLDGRNLKALSDRIESRELAPAYSYDKNLGLCQITTATGRLELTTGDWLVLTPSKQFLVLSNEDFTEEHAPALKPVG